MKRVRCSAQNAFSVSRRKHFLGVVLNMANSFQSEKAVEQAFLSETAPQTTSLQTLASLRALQQFYKDSDAEYQALTDIAKEESRYYIAGALAIKNSPVLQTQLGTGANAAQKAGMLIKARLGEKLFQDQIDAAIGGTGMEKLKLNRTKENYGKIASLIG
jgi:hypothetical protein